MDILVIVIALAMVIFVVVALSQLFRINASLKRLVQLAEPKLPTAPGDLSSMSDEDLMQEYKATAKGFSDENPARNTVARLELKKRGYYNMP